MTKPTIRYGSNTFNTLSILRQQSVTVADAIKRGAHTKYKDPIRTCRSGLEQLRKKGLATREGKPFRYFMTVKGEAMWEAAYSKWFKYR